MMCHLSPPPFEPLEPLDVPTSRPASTRAEDFEPPQPNEHTAMNEHPGVEIEADEHETDKGEEQHARAISERQMLHSCGHTIHIGSSLLFRGIGLSELDRVEEFTATSLSFSATASLLISAATADLCA